MLIYDMITIDNDLIDNDDSDYYDVIVMMVVMLLCSCTSTIRSIFI